MGKPHIMFLGLRGIPDIQGGIETHVENLAWRLVTLGCRVSVIGRLPYTSKIKQASAKQWRGVKLVQLWSPRSRSLETIVHTFIGVLYAAVVRPDILHIHAIGPAIFTPLARLSGLRVIVTHHGADYERQKWGGLAKWILRTGEKFAAQYAHQVISISDVITNSLLQQFQCQCKQIPNGVNKPPQLQNTEVLEQFGLKPGKYVLQVSRIVPEKRQNDLIEAFLKLNTDWKLVIVGTSDHPDNYTRSIKQYAQLSAENGQQKIILTGYQSGVSLNSLFNNAAVFVLPSSHEGLPIALLEALSYGLPCIASNIQANMEVQLDSRHYYPLGDIEALAQKLKLFMGTKYTETMKSEIQQWTLSRYNWDKITKKTQMVYMEQLGVLSGHKDEKQ